MLWIVWYNFDQTIVVNIPSTGGFHIPGFIYYMLFPLTCPLGIFTPANIFSKPSTCNKVGITISVHIHWNGRKIVIVLPMSFYSTYKVSFQELRAFVPIRT